MARRQLAAHAQPALHARRAAGRAGRGLSRRGVLAGPAEGHRRHHRRAARAPGDPRLVDLPRLDAQARRALPAARCRARCTWRAPTPSSWAAARRWSTPTTAAPRTWACRSATTRRWMRSSSTDGRFVAARTAAASASRRRACVLAAGGFESNREWLREAWGQNERGEWPADNFLIRGTRFNQGVLLKHMIDAGRRHHRRPDAGALRGHRRARAAVRRRHLHARRLRVARRRGQPRGACASTTRARTSGPSAMRSGAGWWRSSRGRSPTRIIDSKAIGRFMPPVFPGAQADTLAELARKLGLRRSDLHADVDDYNAACRAGTLRPHGARRLPHRGADAAQDPLGAADRHAAVLRLRAAARHHLHLPGPEDRRAGAPCTSAACRAPTCSSPAK